MLSFTTALHTYYRVQDISKVRQACEELRKQRSLLIRTFGGTVFLVCRTSGGCHLLSQRLVLLAQAGDTRGC
jgi:hypothetical protein